MTEEVQTSNIIKNLLDANKKCFIPQYIGKQNHFVLQLSFILKQYNLYIFFNLYVV